MAQDNAVHIKNINGTPTMFDIHGVSLGEISGGSELESTLTMAFIETAGAGVYTASVETPARFQLNWVGVRVDAIWAADTASIVVDNGLWGASDIKDAGNYPVGRAANMEVGGYGDWGLPYFLTPTPITATLTTTGAGGTTGRMEVILYGSIEPATPTDTAVKS